ncbi:MAG: pyridoxamine 5'-phosphate oxidase family protein [Chloroflexi bacterium]|nr:pyridoxamine 5'-phosphate oxidase family protein [Chloroflexota bacterium]
MIDFTQEMREAIDNALTNGTPCIVATASREGEPNLGYKGSMMAFDGETLAYWERTQRRILEHIEENSHVVVMYRDPKTRLQWRFYGKAEVIRNGPIWEQVMARVVQPELDRDPERKGMAVLIKVDRVTNLGAQILQQRD